MGKATRLGLHLLALFCYSMRLVPAAQDRYQVAVITPDGPIFTDSRVDLRCTITPTPPGPIIYKWRTSVPDQSITRSRGRSDPSSILRIQRAHPRVGRYYCHVLSGGITLGVGSTEIQVQGFIPALVPTSVLFTLRDPIKLQVGMPPENAFTKHIGLTFTWYHNNSLLSCSNSSGITFTGRGKSEIKINSAVYCNATGIYEAGVRNLDFEILNLNGTGSVLQIVDVPHCSNIVLQSLQEYAVLRPVVFHVSESGGLRESSTNQMMNPENLVIVKRDGDVFISVVVTLSSIGGVISRRLEYKWSLNGVGLLSHSFNREHSSIQRRSSGHQTWRGTGGRTQGDYNSSFILLDDNYAVVSLSFPHASTQDVGIYELQVFMSTSDLPINFNSATCTDYVNFLSSSEGLKIRNILLGSSAVQLVLYDFPNVFVTADQVNVGNGASEILNCTLQDNNDFVIPHSVSWKRNENEIITTMGNSLNLNISHSLGSEDSKFGTYSCVVSSQFGTVVETIHIPEKVEVLVPIQVTEPFNCTALEDSSDTSDAILQDIAGTISLACGCNITTGNFIHSSLHCSSNGSVDFVATFAFSNPEGTQLASSVLKATSEWIRGTRKVNQTVYQINTECPISSVEIECTSQSQMFMELTVEALIAVIVGCLLSGLLAGLIVAMGTVLWVLKCRRDPKQLNVHQEQRQVTTSAHSQATLSTDVTDNGDGSDDTGNEQQPRQRSGTQITENLAYGCREVVESDSYCIVYDYPAVTSADRLEDVYSRTSIHENQ